MIRYSTRHEYADFEGRGFCIDLKLGYLHFFRRQRFGYISFYIGLKLIEVKARISAMSGGILFYIGLKPIFKQVVDTERFGYISFYIGLKP